MPPSSPERQRHIAGRRSRLACSTRPTASRTVMKVALHVGMRDGQRATALQLALENSGHHRAGTAQHVARSARVMQRMPRPEGTGCDVQGLAVQSRPAASTRPITEVGFHALSVEISTHRPRPDAARSIGYVTRPGRRLVSRPSSGIGPRPSGRASKRRGVGTPVPAAIARTHRRIRASLRISASKVIRAET